MTFFSEKGRALDLGCATGTDSFSLAELGYSVDAVDLNSENIDLLKKALVSDSGQSFNINPICSDIRTFDIQADKYTLIICNNVLPFISDKEMVKKLISDMSSGLVSGGNLYFSVFGPKDAWAGKMDMSFFESEEILGILSVLPLEIYERSTTEGYNKTMKDVVKYSHIHRFILKKK